jgi:hypothetical protein
LRLDQIAQSVGRFMIRGGLHPPILPANAGAVPRHVAARQIVARRFFSGHPDMENVFSCRKRNWARIICLDQKPQTLTVRARGPRRVSTICSPPLVAELP